MILGVVALVGVAGCAGSSPRADTSPRHTFAFDPMPGMEEREGQVPITEADRALIVKAEFRLVNACMARRGFPPMTAAERFASPSPPSYLSPSELRRGGYQYDFRTDAAGSRLGSGVGTSIDPTRGMTSQEKEAYSEALSGDMTGPTVQLKTDGGSSSTSAIGCTAAARRRLYGSVLNSLRYEEVSTVTSPGALRSQLRRNRGYAARVSAWNRCMARRGHRFAASVDYGAWELRRQQWVRIDKGEPGFTDSYVAAVARADADCQESSGLDRLRRRLVPGAQHAIARRAQLDLGELIAFEHAVLAQAKRTHR